MEFGLSVNGKLNCSCCLFFSYVRNKNGHRCSGSDFARDFKEIVSTISNYLGFNIVATAAVFPLELVVKFPLVLAIFRDLVEPTGSATISLSLPHI